MFGEMVKEEGFRIQLLSF